MEFISGGSYFPFITLYNLPVQCRSFSLFTLDNLPSHSRSCFPSFTLHFLSPYIYLSHMLPSQCRSCFPSFTLQFFSFDYIDLISAMTRISFPLIPQYYSLLPSSAEQWLAFMPTNVGLGSNPNMGKQCAAHPTVHPFFLND